MLSKSLFRTLSLVALTSAMAAPALAQASLPIKSKRVVGGLAYPTRVVFAPGDDTHMYIVEKNGLIRIFDTSTNTLQATPFLDVVSIVLGGASTSDEQGLLGLAFHPDWPNTQQFFIYYTSIAGGGDDTIRRYTALSPTAADPASGVVVKTWDDPFSNHNGGCMLFGTDGYLYVSVGDGGSANDPGNRAQDITDQPLGKMLRIDIDGDDFPGDANKNYAIVPTNPFVGEDGDDEILYYGLRNPWSWNFDRLTGDIWIGDVGQNAWEEIDFAPASSIGTALNFGWRCTEGTTCTGLTGCTCNGPTLTAPVHVYDHGATGGSSTTGGLVYRGCQIPEANGVYFFGDYGSSRFWSFKYVNGVKTLFTVQTTKFATSVDGFTCNQPVAFAQDNQGEMYIVDHGGAAVGQIFKMVRDPAAAALADCDANGTPDNCEIAAGAADCNGNGIPDSCDVVADPAQDCNGNGAIDTCEIAGGSAQDCDANGVIDSCDIASGAAQDCNANGIPDACDIAGGASVDANGDGIPDECAPPTNPADLNGDGIVDGADLGIALGSWGECPAKGACPGDINGDGVVDGADLGVILGSWSK